MSSSPRPVVPRRARPVFAGPTYRAPQYHSRVGGRLVFVAFILLLALIAFVGGGLYWALHHPQGSSNAIVTIQVAPGEGVTEIADRLSQEGAIGNTMLFRLDARLQGLSGSLKVGQYQLRRNMSIDDMVAALKRYTPPKVAVTIPEGWRAEQIAAALQAKGINGKAFLQEVEHPDLKYLNLAILRDKPAGVGLEGYLFPDTYYFSPGYDGRAAARYMVQNLQNKLSPTLLAAARTRGLTVFKVLILASIVEREAKLPVERPTIADVFLNRLAQQPPISLGADPTVQYAVGSPKNWWPVLWDGAAKIAPNSPFNTYTHFGLPPHPISDPGLPSIEAVIHPRPTSYLYFVAVKGGHGRHVFASTLAQQDANIAQYGG